jgi:hypothetical protein
VTKFKQCEIDIAITSKLLPCLDLLEERLKQGFEIKFQDDLWWLFDEKGEGHCSGESIRKLMVNLIMTDC